VDSLEACISENAAHFERKPGVEGQILEAKATLARARQELQIAAAVRIQSAVRAMQARAHVRIKRKLAYAVGCVVSTTQCKSLTERMSNVDSLEACISENAAHFERKPGVEGQILEAKATLARARQELQIAAAVRIQSAVRAMQARRVDARLRIERARAISLAMQGFLDRLPQEDCDTAILDSSPQEGASPEEAPKGYFDDMAEFVSQCGADEHELVAGAIFDRMVTLPHLRESFVNVAFRLNARCPGLCQLLVERIHRDLGVLAACFGVLSSKAAVDGCAPAPQEFATVRQQEEVCAILVLSGHFYVRGLLPLEGLDEVARMLVGLWSAPQSLPESLVKGLCLLLEVAGPILESTDAGNLFREKCLARLSAVQRALAPDGKHLYSDEVLFRIRDLRRSSPRSPGQGQH